MRFTIAALALVLAAPLSAQQMMPAAPKNIVTVAV